MTHSIHPKIIAALKKGGGGLKDLVLRDFERVYAVAFTYYQETRQLPHNPRLVLRVPPSQLAPEDRSNAELPLSIRLK